MKTKMPLPPQRRFRRQSAPARAGTAAVAAIAIVPGRRGFSVLELVVAIAIVMVLVGMLITVSPLVNDNSARARTQATRAALASAIQAYEVDNGLVPRGPASDALDPRSASPATYRPASRELYRALSGDTDADRFASEEKSYYPFKPSELLPATGSGPVTAIADAFGNPWGYSTARQAQLEAGQPLDKGYNPTYDLWSTGGDPTGTSRGRWLKNW
jgi:type II secretory pathway pseudopilin PulG